jgi:gamma-glutamyltranspeptidase/glutathione hydrolase
MPVCLRFFVYGLLLLSSLAAAREPVGPDANPEAATALVSRQMASARHFMAASANPLATAAGHQILQEGGSAIDAAIAMQMVLGLVEPQSSGLGGGAFLLVLDAKKNRIASYDGRETAPMAAQADRFMQNGKPLPFMGAVNSGLAVGTPGVLRVLELAHQKHGRLSWAHLFEPAIRLAETGFPVSKRLHAQIAGNKDLFAQAAARAYFYPDGEALPVGAVLKNPALAAVLQRIAREGADAFYTGRIAADIVAAVQSHARPGDLALQDMAGYRAREREPVCNAYGLYRVCAMGPPSSGGIAVLQMLGMLEQHAVAAMQPASLEAVHYFAEAGRLAFADRDRYVADPDFIAVPTRPLLAPDYLHQRGAWIDSRFSMGVATAGDPAGMLAQRGQGRAADIPSTTHLVAVDRDGNAMSMTSTIESEFGSKILVNGFLLNNQLTDFSLQPVDKNGQPVANRIEGGKRPRSSMAPVLVTKNGQLFMLAGSPGGSAIINYVAKTLIGVLDWQLNVQAAIDLPNMGSRNKETELERGTLLEKYQTDLQRMGHRVNIMPFPSGVQAIVRDKGRLFGGADPRREGSASGD